MAHRPIRTKQANRVRKALRSELPAFIDLVQYLKDRRYCTTTGEAEKIILAGRVKSESHTLGVTQATVPSSLTVAQLIMGQQPKMETKDVVQRYVPASLRGSIQVLPA